MVKNRTAAMAASTIRLKNYILDKPDSSHKDVMKANRIKSEAAFFSILSGLANDPDLCTNGQFRVVKDGQPLTVDEIEKHLDKNPAQESVGPKQAERLLYLYCGLHNAIPYGGLTLDSIINIYIQLFKENTRAEPHLASVKRMIYRDMEELEKLHIMLERSGGRVKKYCLQDKYLPKLTPESAAAVYASMLLYRDTLLDEATVGAREEIEKAFFRTFPDRSRVLNERIYVLGDTLANPHEFGNLIGKLILAVSSSFRIKLGYINNERELSERILEPLGLVSKRSVWYLIARMVENGEYRTFRVDQILSLSIRDSEKFVYPSDFSLTEHIGCSWGVFRNDDVEIVRLKFSPKVAHRVKNLRYHPSQKIIEECSDGSIILEFEVCGLMEMQSWILQWGIEVEVLKPLELREGTVQAARSIIKQYNSKKKRKTNKSF